MWILKWFRTTVTSVSGRRTWKMTAPSAAAKHKEVCTINHSGSSNAMEVAAAKKIQERSTNGPLHYVTMLSDCDSKAYDAVTNMKPYGNKLVKKEECVNHVAKRLGRH